MYKLSGLISNIFDRPRKVIEIQLTFSFSISVFADCFALPVAHP